MLILTLSAALWVILLALVATMDDSIAPAPWLQRAMTNAASGRGIARNTIAASTDGAVTASLTRASAVEPGGDTPPRRGGFDGFARPNERPAWMRLGFGYRPPEPPQVGRAAQIRWWERARSAIGLVLMIVLLAGLFLAALGAVALGAGFFLEKVV